MAQIGIWLRGLCSTLVHHCYGLKRVPNQSLRVTAIESRAAGILPQSLCRTYNLMRVAETLYNREYNEHVRR